MKKTLVVERDLQQSRVSILEDDSLVEVEVESRKRRDILGNIYRGRVRRVLQGMQAAFVDVGLDRDAFLYVGDVRPAGVEGGVEGDRESDEERDITRLLQSGQSVLVQVMREPAKHKGARVTMACTLAGHYLVLLPGVGHVGISRRITDEEERDRLASACTEMRPPGFGLIVRTAATEVHSSELASEVEALSDEWRAVLERASAEEPPALVHGEVDLVARTVRDVYDSSCDRIWVPDEEAYDIVARYLRRYHPDDSQRVEIDRSETGLERFAIDDAVKGALAARVWLRSGAYLVIEATEALVAVDVNSGRNVGRTDFEDTALRVNLEAAREIARQVRLRDLGGIIVIDFIDMADEENRSRVVDALESALSRDRAKSKVLGLSELGLVEMTRRRRRPNLSRVLTRECPHCRGNGWILSVDAIAREVHREALERRRRHGEEIRLEVHPDVAETLEGDARGVVEDLERRFDAEVTIASDAALHHERFFVR